ncbi:MAG: T6SS phospholipase effector Tle1-like catalytic domain-containing protein, partial [Nocardioidaceae bacterium]
MGRNLVVCLDGTANEPETGSTNVARIYDLCVKDDEQLVYYDPGVGTMGARSATTRAGHAATRAAGLVVGYGIRENIAEAYTWLMNHYRTGDNVMVFGFSRGAYTARLLAAVLHSLGLLPRGNQNLIPYVLRLFGGMPRGTSGPAVDAYFTLCDEFRRTFARVVPEQPDDRRFVVHFLGLWDTVSSVGWLWD